MSIIAKSLKKIKEKEKSDKSLTSFSNTSFNNLFFYIVLVIFILAAVYILLNFFYAKKSLTKTYNVKIYSQKVAQAINKYNKQNINIETELKHLLIAKKYHQLKALLKKINKNNKLYLKYSGILYLKEKNYNLSKQYLENYIKKYKHDDEVVSYLSEIYFLENNLESALNLYKDFKNKNFAYYFNQGILYEKLGNFKQAFNFYKTSYKMAKDPLLKKRIYNKLYFLEKYE